MDITLHVGHREFFKLSGKDAEGDVIPLKGSTVTETSLDPAVATVTVNPDDSTVIAIDGISVGQTTVNIDLVNADGVAAQETVLTVLVLAEDIVEVDVEQIGGEVTSDTPFPGSGTTGTPKAETLVAAKKK
jgi:hypothetical protein